MHPRAEALLEHWVGPENERDAPAKAVRQRWFQKSLEYDARLLREFGADLDAAERGQHDDWSSTPRGRLALVILLDQFTRNIYRGSPQAFASDAKAVDIAAAGYDANEFDAFDALDHMFLSLPFSHSENLEHQKRAVRHGVHYANEAPPEWRKMMRAGVDFARKHLDVIARFGRYGR